MKVKVSGPKNFSYGAKLFLIFIVMTFLVMIISATLMVLSQSRDEIYRENIIDTVINYGGIINQKSPQLNSIDATSELFISENLTEAQVEKYLEGAQLSSSHVEVEMVVDYVKRALVLEPSFKNKFYAKYKVANDLDTDSFVEFEFPFPTGTEQKEVSNARLIVSGEEVKDPKKKSEQNPLSYGLYWEGEIKPESELVIEVSYDTVGLQEFVYEGIENKKGSQDFYMIAKIIGTRDYDNWGTLSIDKRNYVTREIEGKKVNGIELVWDKKALFTKPETALSIVNKVNPASQLSSIYALMTPLYVCFIGSVVIMSAILKRRLGGVDMIVLSTLFIIFFPFLHYLTSFTVDPSVEILSHLEKPIEFSMPLYGAFTASLLIVGGLMYYLFGRTLGWKFATGIGLPTMFVFMGFFPLALTIPEYKGLLVLIGLVSILAVVVQMRVSGKITRRR